VKNQFHSFAHSFPRCQYPVKTAMPQSGFEENNLMLAEAQYIFET
jgi:hypothetical protein